MLTYTDTLLLLETAVHVDAFQCKTRCKVIYPSTKIESAFQIPQLEFFQEWHEIKNHYPADKLEIWEYSYKVPFLFLLGFKLY